MTRADRLWQSVPCDDAQAEVLAQELGVSAITARLLQIRGLTDPDRARRFLSPSLDDLLDPFTLADMPVAVGRILRAIASHERIAIHGDYDVDGVTSTVILRRALELLGADVTHFIPERLRDGYGLQPASIDRLAGDGVGLIVSVDCGIRAAAAATHAKALGIDLIITDHHEPDADLPDALAVINPKRHDCSYLDKDLAGVGVAFGGTAVLGIWIVIRGRRRSSVERVSAAALPLPALPSPSEPYGTLAADSPAPPPDAERAGDPDGGTPDGDGSSA